MLQFTETNIDDADVILVSYGASSRAALKAMEQARNAGIKVGSLKLTTVWPFPEKRVAELAKRVKAFVVPEMNFGQIALEVERCTHGDANVLFIPHGEKGIEDTEDLLAALKQAAGMTAVEEKIIEFKK